MARAKQRWYEDRMQHPRWILPSEKAKVVWARELVLAQKPSYIRGPDV